jgi:hypothetical protein
MARQRDDRDGLLVEVDHLLIALLRRPNLRRPAQGSVVIRIGPEGLEVLGLSLLHLPEGKLVSPELPLGPGDALPRAAMRAPLLDGPLKIRDSALGIAPEAFQAR